MPPCPKCGAGPPTVQCFWETSVWEGKYKIAVCTHCAIQAKIVSAGTLFEDISERVARARTLYLMGQQEEARTLLASARSAYERYREVLAGVDGVLALEHSLETAEEAMRA